MATVDVYIDAVTRRETSDKVAKFKRHLYIALIKEGFTKVEALTIAAATQIPISSLLQK